MGTKAPGILLSIHKSFTRDITGGQIQEKNTLGTFFGIVTPLALLYYLIVPPVIFSGDFFKIDVNSILIHITQHIPVIDSLTRIYFALGSDKYFFGKRLAGACWKPGFLIQGVQQFIVIVKTTVAVNMEKCR
jgi:hypothetical protein